LEDVIGIYRDRWEDNVRAERKGMCGEVEWINLAQRQARVAGLYEHGADPSLPIKDGKFVYQMIDW